MRTLSLVLGLLLVGLGLLTLWRSDDLGSRSIGPRAAGPAPARQASGADLVAPGREGRLAAGPDHRPGVVEIPGGPEDLEAQLGQAKFGWTVSGNLRDGITGQPIGEPVDLSLYGPNGFTAGMTDDSGRRYDFAPQEGGRYVLRARAQGYSPFEQEVLLTGIPRPLTVDLHLLPSRRVLVRAVTPDGLHLEDAIARAKLAQADDLTATVSGAAVHDRLDRRPPRRGESERCAYDTSLAAMRSLLGIGAPIPEDALGVLVPFESGPVPVVLALGETVIATTTLEPDATELRFVVAVEDARSHLAVVEVTLEDRLGRPVVGRVSVSPFSFLFRPTRVEGKGVLVDLSPGRHYLVADAEGLETHVAELELQPGERREVTLTLGPARTLVGQVVDEDGQGVLADVHVLHPNGTIAAQGWTDAQGHFRFEGLSDREYLLLLAGDGASATSGTVLDRVAPPQRFTLSAGMAPLRIASTLGATLEFVRQDLDPLVLSFRVLDAQRLQVRRGSLGRGQSTTLRLPVGGYTIETQRRGEVLASLGVSLGSGENRLVLQ